MDGSNNTKTTQKEMLRENCRVLEENNHVCFAPVFSSAGTILGPQQTLDK